jgi:hypothetical protein
MLLRLPRALGAAVIGLTLSSVAFAQSTTTGGQGDRRVWPEEGPLKWAPRPTTSEITANDLRTRLYQFADDSMHGRRIGEPGNVKGTDYIAREFARLGLKPAGDNGTGTRSSRGDPPPTSASQRARLWRAVRSPP